MKHSPRHDHEASYATQSPVLIVGVILGCYAWTTGALPQSLPTPAVKAVETVGMTVANMEVTRSIASLTNQPQSGTFNLVSPYVTLAESQLGSAAGWLGRDLDGHAMQMIRR